MFPFFLADFILKMCALIWWCSGVSTNKSSMTQCLVISSTNRLNFPIGLDQMNKINYDAAVCFGRVKMTLFLRANNATHNKFCVKHYKHINRFETDQPRRWKNNAEKFVPEMFDIIFSNGLLEIGAFTYLRIEPIKKHTNTHTNLFRPFEILTHLNANSYRKFQWPTTIGSHAHWEED